MYGDRQGSEAAAAGTARGQWAHCRGPDVGLSDRTRSLDRALGPHSLLPCERPRGHSDSPCSHRSDRKQEKSVLVCIIRSFVSQMCCWRGSGTTIVRLSVVLCTSRDPVCRSHSVRSTGWTCHISRAQCLWPTRARSALGLTAAFMGPGPVWGAARPTGPRSLGAQLSRLWLLLPGSRLPATCGLRVSSVLRWTCPQTPQHRGPGGSAFHSSPGTAELRASAPAPAPPRIHPRAPWRRRCVER